MPGWQTETVGLTRFESLAASGKDYLIFIEDFVGIPITFIGTGPGRSQLIVR